MDSHRQPALRMPLYMTKPPPDTPAPAPGSVDAAHSKAVGDLVREHNGALHAFIMARVGDAHEATDIAQEAYVRMLQLEEPGAISFLRAYLFRIAANIVLDRARSRRTQQRLAPVEHEEEPVDELSPDRRALSAEEMALFQAALSELPPKCRRAFELCRMQGHDHATVATLLGIQKRMVRHYLTQACAYCRLRIDGLTPEQAREELR